MSFAPAPAAAGIPWPAALCYADGRAVVWCAPKQILPTAMDAMSQAMSLAAVSLLPRLPGPPAVRVELEDHASFLTGHAEDGPERLDPLHEGRCVPSADGKTITVTLCADALTADMAATAGTLLTEHLHRLRAAAPLPHGVTAGRARRCTRVPRSREQAWDSSAADRTMSSMTEGVAVTEQPSERTPKLRGPYRSVGGTRLAWVLACRAMLCEGEQFWRRSQRSLSMAVGQTMAVGQAADGGLSTGSLYQAFGGMEELCQAVLDDYKENRLQAWEKQHFDQVSDPYALIDKMSRFAAKFERETATIRDWAAQAGEADPPPGARRAADIVREIEAETNRQGRRAFSHMRERFSPAQAEALTLLLAPWLGGSPLGPRKARPHLQKIMAMLTLIGTGHGGPVEMSLPDGLTGYVLRADPEDRPAAEQAAAVKFQPPV